MDAAQARAGEAETDPLNVVALEIASLLTSGLAGRRLHDELWRQFADATRPDVFLGIVMAITLYEADLTIAEADLAALKVRQSYG